MTDDNPVRKDSDTGWDEDEHDEANVSYWRGLAEDRMKTIKTQLASMDALKEQLVEATASADRCCENYRERDKEYWNINERFKEEVRNGNELEARNANLEWRVDKLIDAIAKLGGR